MNENKTLRLVLSGFAAGVLNGLLGAGGGILLIASLKEILRENADDTRKIFATALAVMLPVSAVSAILYSFRGDLLVQRILPSVLPAVLGGAAGACLLSRLNTKALKLIFAAMTLWSGYSLLFR